MPIELARSSSGTNRYLTTAIPYVTLISALRLRWCRPMRLPSPTRILVHGYVTVGGRKIGKSAGNSIDPTPLAEELGSDALRYFLLRHIRSTGDGDFSHTRFRQAYESELAGQLGNLVHRVLSMIERYCDGAIPEPPEDFTEADRLLRGSNRLPGIVATHLHNFAFDRALHEIWSLVAEANRYVSEEAPWGLAKAAASPDREAATAYEAKLRGSLFSLSASLQTIARCIAPLLPRASQTLFEKLGKSGRHSDVRALVGSRVETGLPLFPKS